jgi:hypothetical protein
MVTSPRERKTTGRLPDATKDMPGAIVIESKSKTPNAMKPPGPEMCPGGLVSIV